MQRRIELLTLKTFSATGGIEKLSRIIGKILVDEFSTMDLVNITSLYDNSTTDTRPYFKTSYFKGLAGNKMKWLGWLWNTGRKADILIISHSNILPLAQWVKRINKNCRIILMAHGIEVWKPVKHIEVADRIVAVSKFTEERLLSENNILKNKITVINNCIDPFMTDTATAEDVTVLRNNLKIPEAAFVLLAVTRLAVTERYKGYNKVINILGRLKQAESTPIHYVIAGRYSSEEKKYILQVAEAAGISGQVHLPGFVKDENLSAYFKMADAYILPSKKEGFGITFIEAMHYGLPVIAGNQDGSADALLNGELGILVNPDDENEIEEAILKFISHRENFLPDGNLVKQHFSYDTYKENWKAFLH